MPAVPEQLPRRLGHLDLDSLEQLSMLNRMRAMHAERRRMKYHAFSNSLRATTVSLSGRTKFAGYMGVQAATLAFRAKPKTDLDRIADITISGINDLKTAEMEERARKEFFGPYEEHHDHES